MVLEEELKAMVGARRFERVGSRKDHRNGTYLRRLLTSLGQIDVMVPRSREGGSPADVMGRYRRRSEEVDEMMVEACASVWRARLPPSSGPPGLAKAKKRLAEITARWHNELPEAMRVLERGFTAATQFYAFPEPHWARLRTTNSLERLHTEIKRRIRSAGAFPRPSQCTPPHHRGCSEDYCGLERAPLPGPLTPRAQGGRQGSLTEEASRSFPSLLHTTRDLTLAGLQKLLTLASP